MYFKGNNLSHFITFQHTWLRRRRDIADCSQLLHPICSFTKTTPSSLCITQGVCNLRNRIYTHMKAKFSDLKGDFEFQKPLPGSLSWFLLSLAQLGWLWQSLKVTICTLTFPWDPCPHLNDLWGLEIYKQRKSVSYFQQFFIFSRLASFTLCRDFRGQAPFVPWSSVCSLLPRTQDPVVSNPHFCKGRTPPSLGSGLRLALLTCTSSLHSQLLV